ncbi:hypothetical protein PG997_004766 [Apiospora hydei]|uniref:Uncharacterized protein n=1 Tax=Apiospora hydei TaxID=1337664 RepID=A0ABR1X309_9PEZI
MTTHYANTYWPPYHSSSASSSVASGDAGDHHEMEHMHHGGVALVESQPGPSSSSSSSSYHPPPPTTHITLFSMAHATEAMDTQLDTDQDDFDDSLSLGDDDNMEAVSAAHHMAHTQQYTLPPILPSQLHELPEYLQGPLPPGFFIDDVTEDELAEQLHPMPISNANPLSLAPENLNFVDFMRIWAENGRGKLPDIRRLRAQLGDVGLGSTRVEYNQLHGNKCDLQGIDWEDLGVPRRVARERRMMTYRNYTNKSGSEEWNPNLPDRMLRPSDNYYRFRNMSLRRDICLLHFQLRNILGCASRTRAFFPSHGYVKEIDPTSGRSRKAMDFDTEGDMQVSTLTATNDILMVGCFNGDYRFRSLHSENLSYTEGRLTDHLSGITNHVQVYPCRRPDKRLRVMVGDCVDVTIADAETGETLQDLEGHRDFGFACDWAPDGWTVATGFQDKSPLAVLRMEMSGARSLCFSPLGSGKRVLVAAEEADVVNIIDALTFETKQKIDARGGLMSLDRCDAGAEDSYSYLADEENRQDWSRRVPKRHEVSGPLGAFETVTHRRRRALVSGNLDPF